MSAVGSLLPRPRRIDSGDGTFVLTDRTGVHAPDELAGVVTRLQALLRPATGFPLRETSEAREAISLRIAEEFEPEHFEVRVSPTGVTVVGGDRAAILHGVQVLLQLLPPAIHRRAKVDGVAWTIPAVTIVDGPRFRWRGVLLDVARYFLPKHDVLRFIDLMAMHRLNMLHWHLTDDQGWRIEILRYPRLTEVASWRNGTQISPQPDSPTDGRPHGGFYTQDDIREIVAYAAERGVTIVPELDVPGHSQAAIAAYPHLGVTGAQLAVSQRMALIEDVLSVEETTVSFFADVFDEVMDLFPGPYIGVGGDECPKDQWHGDERTQQLMRERGIADEEQLQAWFIRQLDDRITSRGRTLYGWDEILEGDLAPSATVASWRGMTGAIRAAQQGHDVVACPEDVVYLDYRQSDRDDEPIPIAFATTVEHVYAFDPIPPQLNDEDARHVLGGQANIWTEFMDSARVVDYFAFPRLCALAEALWSSGERDFSEFAPRLEQHLRRLDAVGVEYRRASGPLPWQTRPGIAGKPITRELRAARIAELVANIAG